MNCCVTGGCGFIGSHIVEGLLAEGHQVKVFDNLSTGSLRNLPADSAAVRFVRGDIRDAEAVEDALLGAEVVFHHAALVSVPVSVENPRENHDINITGTLNVLEGARRQGVRRVLLASSAAVYGNDGPLAKTEDLPPAPASPYGMAKLAAEQYLRVYAELYGLETVSLRYFNVFGPRQDPRSMYSGVISRFVSAVLGGGNPTLYGDGSQTRDFVFVRDVVAANMKAMTSEQVGAGEVFNIGTGRQTSLLDLLSVLRLVSGRNFSWTCQPPRPGDILHSLADISLARRRLGYAPAHDLRRGLQELLAFEQQRKEETSSLL